MNNHIGEPVYFYNPLNGTSSVEKVRGLCIDQDPKGYCVRFEGMSWWVKEVWNNKD